MRFEIVVIGASAGGLKALQTLLGTLPATFLLPIVIVQHRSADTADLLRPMLQRYSALPVSEPEDKQGILPGRVYLAPADYHLLVEPGHFTLSLEEPVWSARPAIDVLFESAADAYGERTIGVILTGANRDGARGLAAIKRRGGLAIVQDPATATNPAMPTAASAGADRILPLLEIGPFLNDLDHIQQYHRVE
jgi:two-component system chemotaxis response regulator CheB